MTTTGMKAMLVSFVPVSASIGSSVAAFKFIK